MRRILGSVLVCLATGCAVGEEPVDTDEITSDLWVNSSRMWAGGLVRVCWENTDPAYADQRVAVRSAIEQSWQREAALQFTGWGPCNWWLSLDPEVRIGLTDGAPSSTIGTYGAHQKDSMKLNFDFATWGQVCNTSWDQYWKCIKTVAIHEFGHALGFPHEHIRPDAPGCDQPSETEGGDLYLGPYDPDSIMNYCNYAAWNGRLSPGDIVGVQKAYGKRTMSIVGVDGLCLNMPGPGLDSTMTHCAPTPAQRFGIPPLATFPTHLTNGYHYLDVWGGTLDSPIRSWYRNQPDTANQRWSFQNVALRGLGGKCLDTTDVAYAPATLQPCNGGVRQQLTFTPAGEIRTPSGKCLDGSGLTLHANPTCNGGATQRYAWYGGMLFSDNRCVNVDQDSTDNGAYIRLDTCEVKLAQRWSVVGQIRSAIPGGGCVHAASAPVGGGPALLSTCNTAPAETWEIF